MSGHIVSDWPWSTMIARTPDPIAVCMSVAWRALSAWAS
jgi:hypothetical protein